jgi:5-methyltetrahydrofolate--homocysteine methyltransferase
MADLASVQEVLENGKPKDAEKECLAALEAGVSGKEMMEAGVLALMLQKGRAKAVKGITEKLVDEGVPVRTIVDELIAAMAVVGERFKKHEVYVPEVLIAARAMNGAMEVLEPVLVKEGVEPVGSVIIGTVKGDLHDIGKNLVSMMFRGAGFEVIDLGVDVPPETFVEAAREKNCRLIGLSALLTTTMPGMKAVVDALRAEGLDVKVIIGGAPVTQAYADEIGADGYATDAASAVEVGRSLVAAG